MTTVAAVADGTTVWMGADTMTQVYDRPIIGGARKVRRLRSATDVAVLLGVCGMGALAHVLETAQVELLCEPPTDEASLNRWAGEVCVRATAVAAAHHLVEDEQLDGTLLLGYLGRLWTLSNSVAIPHRDGVAALGSGEGQAMGALAALAAYTDLHPAERVERALSIAAAYDKHTAAPFDIEELCQQ